MRTNIYRKQVLSAAAILIVSLSACGKDSSEPWNLPEGQNINMEQETQEYGNSQVEGTAEGGKPKGELSERDLRILYEMGYEGCNTQKGYYYLTTETEKLTNGSDGAHLMYMDFATQQEIYLCSNAGCSHNSPDCPSVFLFEDFMPYTSPLFIHGDGLYILSKDMDNDGGMMSSVPFDGESGGITLGFGNVEENTAILYRMNLDGTEREKIYTFDPSVTLEDYVLGDENGIYVVEKKLSYERDGADIYATSSERRLVYLDLRTREEREVCSMDFEGNISWRFAGCYGRSLVMRGTDYGREVSRKEIYDDDIWKNLYLNSQEVYATFDLDTCQLSEKYRMNNGDYSTSTVEGDRLYISEERGGALKAVNLRDGSERIICTPENECFSIWGIIGDKLYCRNKAGDNAYYYVDVNTGEISYSPLVNKSVGWSLDFRAVLDSEVLVIYDYEALPSERTEGAYEILRYQYGLISKSDLFAGNANYRPIRMIGKGR